jgi:hypothetical protein
MNNRKVTFKTCNIISIVNLVAANASQGDYIHRSASQHTITFHKNRIEYMQRSSDIAPCIASLKAEICIPCFSLLRGEFYTKNKAI